MKRFVYPLFHRIHRVIDFTAKHLHQLIADYWRNLQAETNQRTCGNIWLCITIRNSAYCFRIPSDFVTKLCVFHSFPIEEQFHALSLIICHLLTNCELLRLDFLSVICLRRRNHVSILIIVFQLKLNVIRLTVQKARCMIIYSDLAFDFHIKNKAAFVHMRTCVFRQVKPTICIILHIHWSVVHIVVINKKIIATICQFAKILIYKSLNRRILCRNRKGLIYLKYSLTKSMGFYIMTVKICICSDGRIKAQFHKPDLCSLF